MHCCDVDSGSIERETDSTQWSGISFRLAQSVKIMFAIAIFITYALQCYVPLEIVWNTYVKDRLVDVSNRRKMLVEYVMRTCIVIGTCK